MMETNDIVIDIRSALAIAEDLALEDLIVNDIRCWQEYLEGERNHLSRNTLRVIKLVNGLEDKGQGMVVKHPRESFQMALSIAFL